MKQGNRRLRQVTWKEVRAEVAKLNPALAQVIDDLDPSDELKLYRIDYVYGDHVLHRGSLYVPSQDRQLVHLRDSQIEPSIAEDICYTETIPLGLVLKSNLELYLSFNQHPVPFALMQSGHILALWSVLDLPDIFYKGNMWSITSGARSLYMLPKIADSLGYKKIKKEFGLKSPLPKKCINQWELFREIANHPNFSDPWHSEVLFFSKQWLEKKDDQKWKQFRLFCWKRRGNGQHFYGCKLCLIMHFHMQ